MAMKTNETAIMWVVMDDKGEIRLGTAQQYEADSRAAFINDWKVSWKFLTEVRGYRCNRRTPPKPSSPKWNNT